MILKTALAIKLLLPLAVLAGGYLLLRGRLGKAALLALGALAVVFAVAANSVSEQVPPLRDEVTLTALGKKSEGASAEEVFFTGCTVDGRQYAAGRDMDILDGKWFWSGGTTYCWRVETDSRQPEGVTRSITVGVPVGWGRTLDFSSGVWRGMVEISAGGRTWTVDTYAEKPGTVTTPVGRSETAALIWNQIRYLAVYGLVFLALTAAAYIALVWKRERLARFNERHRGVLIFLAIALVQMAFAMKYAGTDGLWLDELYEVGWSVECPNLFVRAFIDAVPRPISEFILGAWIAIAPYGEKWILLLPELWTAAGIFLVGLCGKAYKNVRTGVFAALFAAVSGTLLQQCSYEIRSYGLFFAAAGLLLYMYIRRYTGEREPRRGETAALCAVMAVFSQTHYFAYVLCGELFLFDAFAHWGLKCKRMTWAPYITLGICTVPCAVMVLRSEFLSTFIVEWQRVPTPGSVNGLIDYFASGSWPLRLLFFLGAALAVGTAICVTRRHRSGAAVNAGEDARDLAAVLPVYLIVFMVVFFLVYGNIQKQATLWSNRYFCCLLPSFFVLCGFGADRLAGFAERAVPGKVGAAVMSCVFIGCVALPPAVTEWESAAVRIRDCFRECADVLYQDINYIFNDSTVIVTTQGPSASRGWEKYYVTRYGKRDGLNVQNQEEITMEDLSEYDRIYVFYSQSSYDEALTDLLDEQYKKISDNTSVKLAVYVRK